MNKSAVQYPPPPLWVKMYKSTNIHRGDIVGKWKFKHKTSNKQMEIEHGNGKKALNIIHWNMGSKLWAKKTDEVCYLLTDYNPDVCIISEANLYI